MRIWPFNKDDAKPDKLEALQAAKDSRKKVEDQITKLLDKHLRDTKHAGEH